jgi:hypothetical protein
MDELLTLSALINAWLDSPSLYAQMIIALPLLIPIGLMVLVGIAQLIAIKD